MPMHSFAQLFATWQWSGVCMCRCLCPFEGNSARTLRVTIAILKGYFTNNQTKPLQIPVHISNTASHILQPLTLKKKKKEKASRINSSTFGVSPLWTTVVCTLVAVNVDRAPQKTQKWVHLPQPCKVWVEVQLSVVCSTLWMPKLEWKIILEKHCEENYIK